MSIANDKKKSAMSSEELEQYGVWVKAGPETVREESSSGDDFSLSDISDVSSEITAEEEDLLGSLEESSLEDGEESLGDLDDFSFDSDKAETSGGADDFELPAAESLEEEADTSGGVDDFSFDDSETNDASSSVDDFSFPELEDIQSAGDVSAAAGIAAGADDDSDDDFTLPTAEPLEEEAADDAETLDLDFSLDEPAPDGGIFDDVAAVENEMTDSLPLEEDLLPQEDLIDIDIDIPEEEPQAAAEDAVQTQEPAAVSASAGVVLPAKAEEAGAGLSAAGAGILSKIEEELASIKAELFELKKELSGLRVAGSAPAEGADEHHKTPGAESGFFAGDEDEDETIALTGDELDNILSTADITEEDGKSDVPDDITGFSEEEPAEESAAGKSSAAEKKSGAEEFMGEDIALDREEAAADEGDVSLDLEEPELAPEDIVIDLDLNDTDEEEGALAPGELASQEAADFGLEEIPEGDEIIIDMADAETEENIEVFEDSNDIEFDDPGVTESIPLTTPEEQAIIEEYNRELDNFGSEELNRAETDGVVSETIGGESAAAEEDAEIEFDLDTLQDGVEEEFPEADEVEIAAEEAEAGENVPAVFQEELEELGLSAEAVPEQEPPAKAESVTHDGLGMSQSVREEIKTVLKYMDQLLESLPEEKIQEFAHSEHFDVYRKLFEELGLE